MQACPNVVLVHRAIAKNSSALFLDRDGVINVDTGYVSDPAFVKLQPGAAAAIAYSNRRGWPVIIVSNQSGIGRGYFDVSTAISVQQRIERLICEEAGGWIDAVFLCCQHPEYSGPLADWRKPDSGMLLAAGRMFAVDLQRSALVGDKLSDMQAASAAGLAKGFLVDADTPSDPALVALGRLDTQRVANLGAAVEILSEVWQHLPIS